MNDSHNAIPSPGKERVAHSRLSTALFAVLAAVLYLALIDAAVETFVSGSPLRWRIAGATVVYLALCAATWRLMPKLWLRMDWIARAAVSVVVLLALLSATSWMSGGLERGLRLFGQPTSIILAIVSAAAVAISGTLLARLRFVPLAGKIVAGVLAAYGVTAFLMAVKGGTPYPALFHGSSQWTKLPAWLQGATIGGLFVLPLALLAEIVTSLRQITRANISEFGFKVTALGMSLVLMIAAVRRPVEFDAAFSEALPSLSGNHEKLLEGEAGYKQVIEKLDRMTAAMEVVNGKIDHSLFEIDALAARLGSDPAAMLHFVRDEIRYEPYSGILRGALGTLICRAGNSLDRSLLLSALLQKAGLTTQIATGQLDGQAAHVLADRLFEPLKPPPNAISPTADLAPELSRALGVEPQQFQRTANAMAKIQERREKELMDYVGSETSFLSNLFDKAGVAAGAVTPIDRLVAEASEHYWVQYQNPGGQWVDLDSAFLGDEPGKANSQATNTFAPDSLPEELYHHLRITLTLRVAQIVSGNDGPSTDMALIDQELRVADQQGLDIVLGNVPSPMPNFIDPETDVAAALASINGYQAMLQIGTHVTAGKYFNLDGQVSDSPQSGNGLGGLAGGISGALAGDSSQASTARIVGEWASYKLTSPGVHGEQPSTRDYRRDIVPTTAVQSWSASSPDNPQTIATRYGKDSLRKRLMWSVELLPVTGSARSDYTQYLQLKSFLDNRTAINSWVRVAYRLPLSHAPSSPAFSPPLVNLALSTETATAVASLVNARFPSVRSNFAQSGLIAHESGCFDVDGGCTSGESFDIVAFSPRAAVNSTSSPQTVREASDYVHVIHGVLATRMEWALLRYNSPGSSAEVRNATEVFRVARDQGVNTATLRPGATGQQSLARLPLPSNIKSEISASLTAGNTLVVPVKPLHLNGDSQIAWWQLNERSGELIGIMPGGRGQGLSEKALLDRIAGTMALLLNVSRCAIKGRNSCGTLVCVLASTTGFVFGFFSGWGGVGRLIQTVMLGLAGIASC